MSKTKNLAQNFMKKAAQSEQNFKESFETVSPAMSPTIGIAISVKLTDQENENIRKLLKEEYRKESIQEEDMLEHIRKLKDITRQIKSINAQLVLLHGQRIKEAQDILANYKDGAFTKWLMATYGNRQTPYSMLGYYELYQSAPISHKALIESVPKKVVYLLASREGNIEKKMKLLETHGKSKQSELVLLIQETFPIAEDDQRQPKNSSTIEALNRASQKLEKNKRHLSDEDIKIINDIIARLQNLQNEN